MSRMRILGASLLALSIGTGAASAADIYNPPPPEVIYNATPAFTWTGGYLGGLIGYGWGQPKSGGKSWDADGWVGGVYGGYNFQPSSNFVLGLETDLTGTGMSGKSAGVNMSNYWNGTIRARAGIAFDRFLVYGTGGLAVGSLEVKTGGKSDTNTRAGYTVGGGVEAALTDTLLGRIEYRYTDFGGDTYNTSPHTKASFSSSQVLVGLGVKF